MTKHIKTCFKSEPTVALKSKKAKSHDTKGLKVCSIYLRSQNSKLRMASHSRWQCCSNKWTPPLLSLALLANNIIKQHMMPWFGPERNITTHLEVEDAQFCQYNKFNDTKTRQGGTCGASTQCWSEFPTLGCISDDVDCQTLRKHGFRVTMECTIIRKKSLEPTFSPRSPLFPGRPCQKNTNEGEH